MAGHAGLHMWGVDHRLAPTEVRERAHLDPERVRRLLEALTPEPGFVSAVPVSTCNRTEIYLETLPGFAMFDGMTRCLAAAGIDPALFTGEYAVRLTDGEAVRRLYRVSAGLESMMLGEPQISGQLKDAYRLAKEHHELGPVLMRAFQGAFRAGKRVRTETKIGEGAVSVAFAAVELARRFFADLSHRRALLVGAGETGALAARHFLQQGIGGLIVVNRSPERARDLAADLNGGKGELVRARPWEELAAALADVDVVLSTTGSLEPVILPEMVRTAMRRRRSRPLYVLDIAVPRDVHPDVARVDETYVFGLDDLDEIVQANLAARRKQLPGAERIIEEELAEFRAWIGEMDLRPSVAEFRAYLEDLKEKQVGYVRRKQSDEVAAAVDASLQQFIKKVLGRSMESLKSAESEQERLQHLATLHRLFAPQGQQHAPHEHHAPREPQDTREIH
jgi:glutamyl-tRNA reductase